MTRIIRTAKCARQTVAESLCEILEACATENSTEPWTLVLAFTFGDFQLLPRGAGEKLSFATSVKWNISLFESGFITSSIGVKRNKKGRTRQFAIANGRADTERRYTWGSSSALF